MGEGIIQPRFYANTFGGKEYAMDIEENLGYRTPFRMPAARRQIRHSMPSCKCAGPGGRLAWDAKKGGSSMRNVKACIDE